MGTARLNMSNNFNDLFHGNDGKIFNNDWKQAKVSCASPDPSDPRFFGSKDSFNNEKGRNKSLVKKYTNIPNTTL